MNVQNNIGLVMDGKVLSRDELMERLKMKNAFKEEHKQTHPKPADIIHCRPTEN